jgi:hypothetical protein
MDAINLEIAKLKEEAASTASVIARPVQPDIQAMRSAYEDSQFLALSVIGLGVFVLCCLTYLIRSDKQIDALLRPFATILIVVAAVFLIVAGYSEKQIAPVIGLLGTIAGYVLGREDGQKNKPAEGNSSNAG